MRDRADLEDDLRQVGAEADESIDLARAALVLAGLDRPRVPLERYLDHLDELASDLAAAGEAAADLADKAEALRLVLADRHGYQGDELTYDDMQNANLMRVIDRRKGLPVALGILYMHAARRQGWRACGLNFPAHFLIRLEASGGQAVLDPFGGGQVMEAPALRQLVKRVLGPEAELSDAYYRPAGNREVLLRLQNNIKTRALQRDDVGRAVRVVERMLLMAPGHAALLRELALMQAHEGNLTSAVQAAEAYLAGALGDRQQHDAAILLQRPQVPP